MKIKSINLYITKIFLIKFLQIILGFSLLIFLVNFIDLLEEVKSNNAPQSAAFIMAFLQIPDFLNDISPSLILMSAIITFFTLSSRSEISIMRMSGFSIWQIAMPAALTAFVIGLFWILIFNPISVLSLKTFHHLEGKYFNDETKEIIAPKTGIWIKQNNLKKPGEEIIIRAQGAYKQSLEFKDVAMWFFDKDGNFYKKINASNAKLADGFWHLKKPIINEGNQAINQQAKDFTIATDLKENFVAEKILNNFQNVKLFSVFGLPKLIDALQSSGLSSLKFQIHLQSILTKPIIFLAMVLIACFFGLIHIRNNNSAIMIFFGVVIGLVLYITSTIVNALGASGIIPVFVATWLVAIICLAVGVLLIYQKEQF